MDLTARTIPVDKNRIHGLARELQQVLAMKCRGVTGPLGTRIIVHDAPYSVTTVDGKNRDLFIRVQSVVTRSPYFVIEGGLGKDGRGHTVVVISVNGSLPAEVLLKSAQGSNLIEGQIFPILLHELTHAADVFQEGVGEDMSAEDAQGNPAYYNHASEVRGYMAEVVDEIEHLLPHYAKFVKLFGPGKALEHALSMSQTWEEVSPYWTEPNRRKVIKSVVQRIEEWEQEQRTARIAARYVMAQDLFKPGTPILYGKFKNRHGILKRIWTDERGQVMIEIEPVPKGRKKTRIMSLYRIWVDPNPPVEQAAKLGADSEEDDDDE